MTADLTDRSRATFAFDYDLNAEASSTSARASANSLALIGSYRMYGTALIYDEDIAELELSRGVNASSDEVVSRSMSGSYALDVLYFASRRFHRIRPLLRCQWRSEGDRRPVHYPLGAPCLLGSVAMLMAAARTASSSAGILRLSRAGAAITALAAVTPGGDSQTRGPKGLHSAGPRSERGGRRNTWQRVSSPAGS